MDEKPRQRGIRGLPFAAQTVIFLAIFWLFGPVVSLVAHGEVRLYNTLLFGLTGTAIWFIAVLCNVWRRR